MTCEDYHVGLGQSKTRDVPSSLVHGGGLNETNRDKVGTVGKLSTRRFGRWHSRGNRSRIDGAREKGPVNIGSTINNKCWEGKNINK